MIPLDTRSIAFALIALVLVYYFFLRGPAAPTAEDTEIDKIVEDINAS